jgi:glycyl-tRNA synthetase beta chain
MKKHSRAPRPAPRAPASDLLFEIGTEELPAAYLPDLIEQLRTEAETLMRTNRLPFKKVEAFGTPRRLVLIVRGLSGTQHKPAEEVRGPSKQAAYDKEGKPTQALLGFLRSQGGNLSQVKIVKSERGDYLYLVKPPTATPTAKILPNLLPQLIRSLRAPKSMRWDGSGARFARPIRWLAALLGTTPVACAYGALAAAPKTWVGGPLRPRSLRVTSVESHRAALKKAKIVLDQNERKRAIERLVAAVAKQFGGAAAPETVSHGLLEEVTCLVEQPVPLAGAFDPKFLALPREVLLASMAKYQRVFAIEGRGAGGGGRGSLLPKFAAILDGKPGKPNAVRVVIERILNARLADSLMFLEQDRRRPLQEFVSGLSGVTLHEKLGSMQDKALRLHKLAAALESAWRLTRQELGDLRRACELAKADLVTTMVKEFPTLQGVIGKHYAAGAGETEAVAAAIEEHYLPLAGKAPKTLIGSALSILDKYDTLASYFSIGIEPTGDQDPFGLRRAAQGIVEVAWAIHRPLPLQGLFSAWQASAPFAQGKAQAAGRVQAYLLERCYTFAWPKPVPAIDCIDAVLETFKTRPCDDLVDAMDRVRSLQQLDGHPGLRKAAKVIERTRNILKGAKQVQGDIQPNLFREEPEQILWQLYEQHKSRVTQLAEKRQYDQATTVFGDTFYEPLHRFFDQVLVNVPDEALQRNRLALMRAIHTLYTDRIADLSKLTLLQHEETS